ncbi:TPA: hypothetical protein U2B98_001125 [Streptococcus suis]|uniref:hypothetical protein n=1 Tax=Streptococcus suis TaxID=1307 RepID=UPI00211D67C2|nr:hypothetical protein [Streptococcus suis]UUM57598.1 hypothetical protein NQZ91_09725 [Streptococcus suis]HEM6112184.1 hypothetical protein [Streptococcus suis]HEM6320034.1 hypothetical protein [Streptococcus suis]
MPNRGDQFTVTLGSTNIGWGTYRHTNSRPQITGECYIPIPSSQAHQYGIYNSNHTHGRDILGINIFNAQSADGYFNGIVKTSGSSQAGNIYAKNLSGQGNLKAFNDWFNHMGVTVGTSIIVEWISPTEILFTII